MKNKIKCKDCKSRYVGCHSECADYIEYDKERKQLLELKHEHNKTQDELTLYRQSGYHKTFIHNSKRRNKK